MAITAAAGNKAASNGAVGSIACGSFNTTNSGRIVVVVVLLDNTLSVSTVLDTSGTATYSLIAALDVSSTLRIEYWRSDNPATKTGDVITATLASGTTPMAIAAEQYTGDVGLLTGTSTFNGSDIYPYGTKPMAFQADWIITLIGWNGASTDTLTAEIGTIRQSGVGAAGAAGVAIIDQTETVAAALDNQAKLNNSRTWGSIVMGLQGSSTTWTIVGYTGVLPLYEPPTVAPGTMPSGGGGGILPPAGDGQIFPPTVRPY